MENKKLIPEVIFENDRIVAINKPAHLVIHPGVGTGYTLVDWILEKYPMMKEVGEHYETAEGERILRPGIVHRLDKETSGVMLLAKTEDSYKELKKLFKKRKIRKEYRAFVYGTPSKPRGTIALPLGRSRFNFKKRTTNNPRGELKDALTEYAVMGSCANKAASFVRFYPKTGRMHQIRAHSKTFQFPIVCDKLYAPNRDTILGFERTALHSYSITLPLYGEESLLTIKAPYPKDFEEALKSCEINDFDKTE